MLYTVKRITKSSQWVTDSTAQHSAAQSKVDTERSVGWMEGAEVGQKKGQGKGQYLWVGGDYILHHRWEQGSTVLAFGDHLERRVHHRAACS